MLLQTLPALTDQAQQIKKKSAQIAYHLYMILSTEKFIVLKNYTKITIKSDFSYACNLGVTFRNLFTKKVEIF